MTARRKYPRAPIQEAIIDFQFPEPIDREIAEKLKSKLQDEYPLSSEWKEIAIKIDATKQATDFEEAILGYRLSNLDQVDVLIAADKRFAVSRLAPYTGWDPFRERAKRNWSILKGLSGYRKIARIGIRYVNRVDIPLDGRQAIELSDYFAFYIQVPQPPFPVRSRHTIQAIFETDGGKVIVNSGAVPSPLVGYVSYALDIDVIREVNVPQSDNEVWAYIDQVRDRKNELFEACITDRSRALFEK